MSRQQDIIKEIVAERKFQDEKWGEQNHPMGKWLLILMEEVGETTRSVLDEDIHFRHEMIQVAAVALAAVECWDRKLQTAQNKE
jgi:NTP pyrophosphatase (non-canonical NTP hydrolase)